MHNLGASWVPEIALKHVAADAYSGCSGSVRGEAGVCVCVCVCVCVVVVVVFAKPT